MATGRFTEHRYLGSSGTPVGALGLGTMTFGAEADEPGAPAQFDRFVEAGATFVDAADVYSRGVSVEIIGRWLDRSGNRDRIVLAFLVPERSANSTTTWLRQR